MRPLLPFQPKMGMLASKFPFSDNEDVVPAHLAVPGRWEVTDGRRELPYGPGSYRKTLTSPSLPPSATLIWDLLTSSLSNCTANGLRHSRCSWISGKGQAPLEAHSITGLSWKCGGKWESDDGSGHVGGMLWAVYHSQCPQHIHVTPPLITVMNSREYVGTARDPQAAICLISAIYKLLESPLPSSDHGIHHRLFHLLDYDLN